MTPLKKVELNAGGKKRTFHFGMGAMGIYLENVKKDGVTLETISDKMAENPFSVVPKLMYYTYAYGFIRQGKEVDATVYDIADWIDEDGGLESELLNLFIEAFGNSFNQGAPTEKDMQKLKGKSSKPGKPGK